MPLTRQPPPGAATCRESGDSVAALAVHCVISVLARCTAVPSPRLQAMNSVTAAGGRGGAHSKEGDSDVRALAQQLHMHTRAHLQRAVRLQLRSRRVLRRQLRLQRR